MYQCSDCECDCPCDCDCLECGCGHVERTARNPSIPKLSEPGICALCGKEAAELCFQCMKPVCRDHVKSRDAEDDVLCVDCVEDFLTDLRPQLNTLPKCHFEGCDTPTAKTCNVCFQPTCDDHFDPTGAASGFNACLGCAPSAKSSRSNPMKCGLCTGWRKKKATANCFNCRLPVCEDHYFQYDDVGVCTTCWHNDINSRPADLPWPEWEPEDESGPYDFDPATYTDEERFEHLIARPNPLKVHEDKGSAVTDFYALKNPSKKNPLFDFLRGAIVALIETASPNLVSAAQLLKAYIKADVVTLNDGTDVPGIVWRDHLFEVFRIAMEHYKRGKWAQAQSIKQNHESELVAYYAGWAYADLLRKKGKGGLIINPTPVDVQAIRMYVEAYLKRRYKKGDAKLSTPAGGSRGILFVISFKDEASVAMLRNDNSFRTKLAAKGAKAVFDRVMSTLVEIVPEDFDPHTFRAVEESEAGWRHSESDQPKKNPKKCRQTS